MHFITVRIVFAFREKAWSKLLQVRRGATPMDIIELSGLLNEFPDLVKEELRYGVYSKQVNDNYLMLDNDRLEIYRPLKADPKLVRREQAKAGKTMTDNRD